MNMQRKPQVTFDQGWWKGHAKPGGAATRVKANQSKTINKIDCEREKFPGSLEKLKAELLGSCFLGADGWRDFWHFFLKYFEGFFFPDMTCSPHDDATRHAFAHRTSVSSEQTCGTDGPTDPRLREGSGEKQRERDVNRRYRTCSEFIRPTTRWRRVRWQHPRVCLFFSLLLHRSGPEKQFAQLETASRRLDSYWSEMTGMSEPLASQPGSHTATLTCKDVTLFFYAHSGYIMLKKKSFALQWRRAKKRKEKESGALGALGDICISLAYFLSDLHPSLCAPFVSPLQTFNADAHMFVWVFFSLLLLPYSRTDCITVAPSRPLPEAFHPLSIGGKEGEQTERQPG